MKTLLTSFRAEWLRLVHSRGTWMAAFAVLLVAFFRVALERLKREVPIWKREHYADGEVTWREEEPLGA